LPCRFDAHGRGIGLKRFTIALSTPEEPPLAPPS
jgi:hypothetical protein